MPQEEAEAGLRSQSTGGIRSQVKAGVADSLLSITTPKHGQRVLPLHSSSHRANCLKTRNIVYFWEDPVLLINQRVNTCVAIRRTASSTRANLERWESSPHADFWPVKLPGGGGLRPAVLTPARASSKPRSPSMAGTGPRSPRRPWSIVSLTDIKA